MQCVVDLGNSLFLKQIKKVTGSNCRQGSPTGKRMCSQWLKL